MRFREVGQRRITRAAHVRLLEGIGRRVEVPSRQMEINRRVRQIGVAQQELNRAQVSARFEQMCGVRVRSVCGVTRLSIPPCAPRDTASQITLSVMGASARQPWCVPGNR